MGIEAVNYSVYGARACFLQRIAAWSCVSVIPKIALEGSSYFALHTTDYWIDLELAHDSAAGARLSIRIALCNKVAVLDILRRLLRDVQTECAGVVVDEQSGCNYKALPDDVWQEIVSRYEQRYQQFQVWFGDRHFAVSADDVWALVNGSAGEQ